MAGGTVHGSPYEECLFLTRWWWRYQPWLAARASRTGVDWRGADAGWLMDVIFDVYIEIALTEKGDKRLEFIDRVIARTRGELPAAPGQETPQDPALPKGAGRPVNEQQR